VRRAIDAGDKMRQLGCACRRFENHEEIAARSASKG
jgi:hypothetical protein